jgi:CheY-like chemotaxis protein
MYPLLLIVDDDAETRNWVKLLLELDGYDVLVAADGYEAVQIAKTQNPALIVTDLMMPGMDGVSLCAELERDPVTASIPVIVCSAYPGRIPAHLACRVVAVLPKPLDVDQLETEIASALQLATMNQI